MSDSMKRSRGGCRCGAVRFEAAGEPNKVSYCHCESCRAATGAPVSVAVMYEAPQVRFTRGAPRRYASSPGVERGFCGTCGTPLSWAGVWHDRSFMFLFVGAFDEPDSMPPDRHAFCTHRLDWFDTADDLPRFPETSPDSALIDVRVDRGEVPGEGGA